MPIRYIVGDATRPQGDGQKLVCHIVNTSGGWGAGFVLALSKRWKEPERVYRDAWSMRQRGLGTFYLGAIHVVKVEDDISVANMVVQKGYTKPGQPAVDYEALGKCLETVAFYIKTHPDTSVHCPRPCAGLGVGSWPTIEKLINDKLGKYDVTVYDLPEKKS